MKLLLWIAVTALLGTLGVLWLASSIHRHRLENLGMITALGPWDTDPAVWGRTFPRQYQTWLERSKGKRLQTGPEWKALYAGFSLAEDGERSPGIQHPAVCLDCHEPRTQRLRVTRHAFSSAMARRGIDVAGANAQAMRTYVCAQCHGTYHLPADGTDPVMPWDQGLNVDDILAFYRRDGMFAEWTHAVSRAPMLKLRHPEFELWSQGVHATRGVSCADCHMAYRCEGTARFSDHSLKNPVDVQLTCGLCHHEGETELRSRVDRIQDVTRSLLKRAQSALVAAHARLGACVRAGVSDTRLKSARALLREAQARWDFIASDGSTGFHAPQESARILGVAIDQARQAELEGRAALAEAERGKNP